MLGYDKKITIFIKKSVYIIYGYAVGSATNFKYIYLSISQIKMFLNLYKYVLVPFYIKNVWSKNV